MTDLAKLVVRLEAQTAQYMKGMEAANKKLDKFTKSADISAAKIAKGVAAAAISAGVAFGAMAKSAVDHGDALDEMSQRTGISVESLSRLEYAARFSGVALEDLAKSQGKMAKQMVAAAQGSKSAQKAFQQIGVAIKNTDGSLRSSEEVMLDVAEKFSKMEDGAGKTAIAMEIFGKSGAAMIPFLNEGREGIARLSKEADALGVTMSEKTAKQAAEFNDSMDRIKGATTGLVNQFIEKALPSMIAIADAFLKSATAGGNLSAAIGVLALTFKTLVSAGIIVKTVFQTLGRLIYGVGEALVRVAQGEFKLAAGAIKDAFAESRENVTNDIELIAKVWETLPEAAQDTAKKTDDALKTSIMFNPEKAKSAAEKAAESAVESLQEMARGLGQQVQMFGMSEQAAVRYSAAQGDLADLLNKAGEAGRGYVDTIIMQTDELARLNDAQEKSKAAQDALNQATEDGKAVTESILTPMEKYMLTLEKLDHLRTAGAISNATFSKAADKAKKEMEDATKVVNKFLEQANENTQSILGDGIYQAMTEGASKGAKGMLKAFEQMLMQLVAQALAADIAGKLFGGEGMGSGGGWVGKGLGFLGGLFSRDSGGRGSKGQPYLIGTGAQPEMFVPDTAGTFVPANQWMGNGRGGLTQNFYVPERVTSRSARQLAMDSSRGQRQAAKLGG